MEFHAWTFPVMPVLPPPAGLLFASQRFFRKEQGVIHRCQATRGRIVKTWKLCLAVLVGSMLAGVATAANPVAVPSTAGVDPWRDGYLHVCLLLPEADALSDVSSLRRHLRALLLQADALPDLSALRRHLRAVLLQADALFLHAHRPAGVLRDAAVRRAGR